MNQFNSYGAETWIVIVLLAGVGHTHTILQFRLGLDLHQHYSAFIKPLIKTAGELQQGAVFLFVAGKISAEQCTCGSQHCHELQQFARFCELYQNLHPCYRLQGKGEQAICTGPWEPNNTDSFYCVSFAYLLEFSRFMQVKSKPGSFQIGLIFLQTSSTLLMIRNCCDPITQRPP